MANGARRAPSRFDFYGYLPYGLGCNLGVSRRAFDAVDGFDETIMSANDLDLCWRLQLAGHPLHVESAAVVAKRGRLVCGAIWRQHFTYGLDDPKLYRRFRAHGMPRKLGRAARRYAWLVAHLHHLRSPSDPAVVDPGGRRAGGPAGRDGPGAGPLPLNRRDRAAAHTTDRMPCPEHPEPDPLAWTVATLERHRRRSAASSTATRQAR